MNLGVGKKNDDIETPAALKKCIYDEFKITHDPCPLHSTVDGLDPANAWGTANFVNPPYSNIEPWIDRCIEEATDRGNLSVCLITCRPHTDYWFDKVIPNATDVRVFRRFPFEGYTKKFAMPICLVVFDPTKMRLDAKRQPTKTEDNTYEYYSVAVQ